MWTIFAIEVWGGSFLFDNIVSHCVFGNIWGETQQMNSSKNEYQKDFIYISVRIELHGTRRNFSNYEGV